VTSDEKRRAQSVRAQQRLAQKRASEGRCVACGRQGRPNRKLCLACVEHRAKTRRELRRRRWIARICVYCGKAKPSGTHLGCEPCLQRAVARMERSRERKRAA
jgi:hypothetical protein